MSWVKVVHAHDCLPCLDCGEPVCQLCSEHYADCACPGPHQDDQFTYLCDPSGTLWAKEKP